MNIKNIMGIAVAMLLTVTAKAQIQSGTMVPLGSYLEDAAGNRYQVVLQPVAKPVAVAPAPVVVAPAPVVVAPAPVVVQQPQQVVYQQAPQVQQGSGVGKYVGDVLVTGAGGAAQGAILGGVTGRNVGKETMGMAGGAVGGKVATDLLNGIFKR
jgi:hypothetical protein